MKVLLVEDNESVAGFVRKGLTEAGHVVDHANNGRDGMFLAASEPYDVIVMDRMLPGEIDGLGQRTHRAVRRSALDRFALRRAREMAIHAALSSSASLRAIASSWRPAAWGWSTSRPARRWCAGRGGWRSPWSLPSTATDNLREPT